MRFLDFTWFITAVGVAACGGSRESETTGPGGAGGGSGGAATTTSSTSTITTTSTTSTTTTPSTGTGGDKGMPSDVYPAPHAEPPSITSYGGPVLANPVIVPVFFANEDPATVISMTDFAQKIGSTDYWAATTAEYGVGPATSTPAVSLTEVPPDVLSDSDVQTWLRGKLNKNDPAFPAPDADTVYVLHYPEGTAITAFGDESCFGFGGYHSNVKLDAAHGSLLVAYAVIPYCDGFGGNDGIDGLTAVESHELIEAATDPYPNMKPAYASVDDAHFYWAVAVGGGENADMCAQNPSAFATFDELPYAVQRSWSNVSANAGHDPCVPTFPGEVYFNAAPELPDDIQIKYQGIPVTIKGVNIPVGGTRTIEVHPFSDGDTGGGWDIEVDDYYPIPAIHGSLALSLDRNSAQNGEKLYLTITVHDAGPNNVELFRLVSKGNGTTHQWFGAVGR